VARRLSNVLTLLSLLLCAAAAAAWGRSYLVGDRIVRSHWRVLEWDGGTTTHERYLGAQSGRGVLHLYLANNYTSRASTAARTAESRRHNPDYFGAGRLRWEHNEFRPALSAAPPKGTFAGFGYQDVSLRGGQQASKHLYLPWPFVAACFAVAPALRARRWWGSRRRAGARRCPSCGYDLRATPGRCPECGTRSGGVAECC
jgi:hypothetical protein